MYALEQSFNKSVQPPPKVFRSKPMLLAGLFCLQEKSHVAPTISTSKLYLILLFKKIRMLEARSIRQVLAFAELRIGID